MKRKIDIAIALFFKYFNKSIVILNRYCLPFQWNRLKQIMSIEFNNVAIVQLIQYIAHGKKISVPGASLPWRLHKPPSWEIFPSGFTNTARLKLWNRVQWCRYICIPWKNVVVIALPLDYKSKQRYLRLALRHLVLFWH